MIRSVTTMNVNTSCTLFPANPNNCEIIVTAHRTSSSLSLAGCMFMIFTIWLFRRYVVFSQRLVLYLSIGSLLDSVAYLVDPSLVGGGLCQFQAWFMNFSNWNVLLLVASITLSLFINVVKFTATSQFEW